MTIRLNYSTMDNKIAAYQKAFISHRTIDYSDRTPGGLRSSLVGIPISRDSN